MTPDLGTCEVSVTPPGSFGAFRQYLCRKPGKEVIDGKVMCGRHAAGHRRSLASREARQTREERNAAQGQAVQEALDRLGVKGYPQRDPRTFAYTGRAIVSIAELERLAGAE